LGRKKSEEKLKETLSQDKAEELLRDIESKRKINYVNSAICIKDKELENNHSSMKGNVNYIASL
jgi:hypothetical protein